MVVLGIVKLAPKCTRVCVCACTCTCASVFSLSWLLNLGTTFPKKVLGKSLLASMVALVFCLLPDFLI